MQSSPSTRLAFPISWFTAREGLLQQLIRNGEALSGSAARANVTLRIDQGANQTGRGITDR